MSTPRSFSNERSDAGYAEQTGWVGWIVFAATILILLGCFHILAGITALFRDQVFLVGHRGLVVSLDYTAWGWVHIVGGVVAILVGGCLLKSQTWARIVAVLVAGLSALVNVAFLPSYPVWSTIMIAMDFLVIWAITVHGGELKGPSRES